MAAHLTVRRAGPDDAVELLELMKNLARFEHYAEQFCVTEQDLIMRGLNNDANSQFIAYLAVTEDLKIAGYAVVYLVPFTFDLKPNLILKELYVKDNVRGSGVGRALMDAVVSYAKTSGCKRVKWDVLPENHNAKYFYRSVGGEPESGWENWIKNLE